MERNRRDKKTRLSFKDYLSMIEELLKLTNRKKKKSEKILVDGFKL